MNDTIGIKMITRLRLSFSHLQKHKSKQFERHIKSTLFLQYRRKVYLLLLSVLPFL